MRLTLRTLLAYLDKVLEPGDAKDLQEKVSQGRLARGMVERIQAVVRRPKLAAPKVDARGTAGDANIVAEYLDNTLPAHLVADFEQACLAEDARLAEVAGCHQILTIVLATPATVSTPLRNRIRLLGKPEQASSVAKNGDAERRTGVLESLRDSVAERNGKRYRVDSAHRATDSVRDEFRPAPPRPMATAGLELDDKLISHVPEYLKSGKTGDWSNSFIIVGLLAALAFVVWLSIGSLDEIQALLHRDTNIVKSLSDEHSAQRPLQPPEPNEAMPNASNAIPPEPSMTVTPPPNPSTIVEKSSAPPSIPSDKTNEDTNPFQPTIEERKPIEEKPVMEQPPPVPSSSKDTSNEAVQRSIQWQPETKESAASLVFSSTRDSIDSPPSIRRLVNGDSLSPDEKLVVPPAFRTEFNIAPGIRWIAADATVLVPNSTQETQTAAVELRLGRAIVHATPDCSSIVVQSPLHSIAIRMNDSTSIVAVELRYKRMVSRTFDQAVESLTTHPNGLVQPVLSVVCVAGATTLELSGEEPLTLEVGEGGEWTGDASVRTTRIKDIPWWYRTSAERPIDADAAEDLMGRLSKDPNLNGQNVMSTFDLLRAAIASRRGETSALALRTMFLFGEYTKCFGSDGVLSNPASRPHRNFILEALYQSLGIGPEHVSVLKETIEIAESARAPRLLGLLCLPDDAQLAEGVDRSLVESLGSPLIDERILGIYQLSAILGKDHGFQIDRPNTESVQLWQRLLNSGGIRWPK